MIFKTIIKTVLAVEEVNSVLHYPVESFSVHSVRIDVAEARLGSFS